MSAATGHDHSRASPTMGSALRILAGLAGLLVGAELLASGRW
jgi:hypothetical protein